MSAGLAILILAGGVLVLIGYTIHTNYVLRLEEARAGNDLARAAVTPGWTNDELAGALWVLSERVGDPELGDALRARIVASVTQDLEAGRLEVLDAIERNAPHLDAPHGP